MEEHFPEWLSAQNIKYTNSNTQTNSSHEGVAQPESLEFKAIKITFYFMILASSTMGNGMVAYIIMSTRSMRTSSNYLILNLAICDLLTPLISIPFDFAVEENHHQWLYGWYMCKTLFPAATLTATSSALTLAVISLDRYRLIMHPFRPRLTAKQIKIAITCIYGIALALVAPYISVLQVQGTMCTEEWSAFVYRQAYTVVLFLFQYALPLPFMITMYTLALINLYSSTRKTTMMQRKISIPTTTIYQVMDNKNGLTVKDTRQRKKSAVIQEHYANQRATKMFITVVSVFAVCMLPNQLAWLWMDFSGAAVSDLFTRATIICWLFTYANSVFNPVIFTFFSRDFRHGMKDVIKKVCQTSYKEFSSSRRSSASGSRRPSQACAFTSMSNSTAASVNLSYRPITPDLSLSISETVL